MKTNLREWSTRYQCVVRPKFSFKCYQSVSHARAIKCTHWDEEVLYQLVLV